MSALAGYYRHPTISGDRIVFVCEDDLWSVPVAGGVARRLTANPGTVSFPLFSPDGSKIAFVGRDDGPAEAYVMDALGGTPRRLTHWGSFTATVGWSRDGSSVIAASDKGQPFRGYYHLHAVPTSGEGAAKALRYGPARAVSFQPDGDGVVIGRNSGDPARWKRYRGGTAGTIWVDRKGDGAFAPLVRLPGNLASPMWIGDRIWFLSDHEGHGNLYSCRPTGNDLVRHTHHEDFYVRFPSTDGRRIAYHAGADLYVFDTEKATCQKVDVRLHSDRAQRNRKFVSASRHLESADLHPDGHTLAAVVRGGVHAMGLWDGAPSRIGSAAGGRHRLAQWLPDGKRVVAVSDASGEEGIVVLSTDPAVPPRRVALEGDGADLGRALDAVAAPAGADRVALSNQRHEVILVDVASGKAKVLEKSPYERVDGMAWSPDGRWLAYAMFDTRRTSSIHLCDTRTGRVTRATRSDFRDASPSFDPEGRWLYFTSWRVFDPIYDSLSFDLGFPKGSRPCLVTLRKDVASPFSAAARAPRAPGTATTDAASATVKPVGAATKPASKPSMRDAANHTGKGPAAVEIDFEGIEDRVVAFPVPEGRYLRVIGTRGRAFLLSVPPEGALDQDARVVAEPSAKGTLEAFDFAEDKVVPVLSGVTSFTACSKGGAILVRSGNRLRAITSVAKAADIPAKDEATRETGWIDLERLRVSVVPGDEWKQMFREAWRLQRDQFWTPDMSGIDWVSTFDRYLPLVDRVASRAEFSDLAWEVQGELNTSHAYEMGGDYRPEPAWHQGFLGADLELAGDAWRVARIPRGDSWDPARASPLASPGAQVEPGDRILEVDGLPVGRGVSPSARLVHAAGRDVSLLVRRGKGDPRLVSVRALRDEQPLRYRDWVEANRARVHEESKGRVGYVHIPNMGPLGFSEFHRYFLAEVDHDALIVDVRWNGGGHVSQLLLAKLARKRLGFNRSRWMGEHPYPDDAPAGPLVALTNEYAGSDGDIFSHCWKLLKMGPLVGKRTWGGVVGIWPRHALVDGTVTTQPEFAFWFHDVGYGVEGHGTDPDVEVEITPQDHAAGRDPQLERGLALAKKALVAKAPGRSELLSQPSRKPPKLKKV